MNVGVTLRLNEYISKTDGQFLTVRVTNRLPYIGDLQEKTV